MIEELSTRKWEQRKDERATLNLLFCSKVLMNFKGCENRTSLERT